MIFLCNINLFSFLRTYLDRALGIDKLKTLTNFLIDNFKEVLFYIVTNVNTMYKNKISEIDKQINENNIIVKDLELARDKIREINNIYEDRIRSFMFDKEMKEKEIKYKLERISNLEREYEIINAMKEERIKEEMNLKNLRQQSVTHDIRKSREKEPQKVVDINTNYEVHVEKESQCAACECIII